MSGRSMFKKMLPKPKAEAPKEPRSKQTINEEYTAIAQQLGAKTVEQESIKRQIAQLISKVDQLGQEMTARTTLDAKADTDKVETPAVETEVAQ